MMPEMDGYEALEKIRGLESAWGIQPSRGVKVLVTTALDRVRNVAQAFRGLCDAYLVKPIDAAMLQEQLRKFELI
jgi:two-component system, chemotaxis family, chemotaxis protein CheY